MGTVIAWLDERFGVGPGFRAIFLRHIPVGVNWWYSLGSAALFLLVMQIVTGSLLAMYYSASPQNAYDSIRFIMAEVPFGWFIRGLHHWGATAMVAVVLLHLVSVFVMGAHRYPREGIWLFGVGLLLITLGFGFTGYLLPWDEKAYWATVVGTNMAGTVPFVGTALVQLIRGGAEVGIVTLSRFYALHVLVFPLTIAVLAGIHLVLVIYHGVSVMPGLWHGGLSEGPGAAASASRWRRGLSEGPGATAAASQQEVYHQRYMAFKSRGPTFWPDLIAEDLRASMAVFVILMALTIFVGIPLDARADPTNTAYIPRPEWYFMALFELLKYFPGALEWVGVVVIPSALILLLVLTPWLSKGEERRPSRRPLGMATLAVVLLASVGLTARAYQTTPSAEVVERGVVLTAQQLRGRQIIQQQGCGSCHVINDQGGKKGPPLDDIGSRLTTADIHSFMENPSAHNPSASMKPLIPPLTHEDVEAITQYLLTLTTEVPQ